MSVPIVTAIVKVKDIEVMLAHHLSEAIGPWADSIKVQTKAMLEAMDIEAEIAKAVQQEIRSAIHKKVADLIKETIESDEFTEQVRQVVATKIREGLEKRIEEEVRSRIDGYIRQNVMELFNGDIRVLVDRQMTKYKGQKDNRPWWRKFGRG